MKRPKFKEGIDMKSSSSIFFAICLIATSVVVSFAAEKSLVLYLPFDGTLDDQSDTGLKGKFDGKTEFVDGQSGKALLFEGNSSVEIPHDKRLNLTGEHTISFWIQWEGVGASWCPFVAKRTAGGANYQSWVGSDRIFDYYNGTAVVSATTPVPLGKDWVFLTTTHDGKDTVSFYVNGDFNAKQTAPPGKANTFPLLVGTDGVGNFGAGGIDELALFDRALTADEIQSLMKQGVKAFAPVEPIGKLTATWASMKSEF
jgi:hypothetical protein